MTLALRDLQAAFADHLLGRAREELAAEVMGGRIPAEARLRIHRHHILSSLTRTLASTFPTVSRLVGEQFFGAMARAFSVAAPPTGPVLSEYGEGFAAFIAEYGPAQSLAYLADVARLDWALNVAFNSPVERRLDAQALTTIPMEELPAKNLDLAPGAMLLESPYPLDKIWRAAQPDASAEMVDIEAGGVCLLIHRQTDDAAFIALEQGEAAFLKALGKGASMEQATEASFAQESEFDLSMSFPRLLALGVFAALQ